MKIIYSRNENGIRKYESKSEAISYLKSIGYTKSSHSRINVAIKNKRIAYGFKWGESIIDLIEAGDIAIIEYYVSKYRQRITRIFECDLFEDFVTFENRHCKWWYNKSKKQWEQAKGYNPKIKAIVTHQQFNSIKYEVE